MRPKPPDAKQPASAGFFFPPARYPDGQGRQPCRAAREGGARKTPSHLSCPHPAKRSRKRGGRSQPQRWWTGYRHGNAEDRATAASEAPNRDRKPDPARPSRRKRSSGRSTTETGDNHGTGKRPSGRPHPPARRTRSERRPDQRAPPRSRQRRSRAASHHQRAGWNDRKRTADRKPERNHGTPPKPENLPGDGPGHRRQEQHPPRHAHGDPRCAATATGARARSGEANPCAGRWAARQPARAAGGVCLPPQPDAGAGQ